MELRMIFVFNNDGKSRLLLTTKNDTLVNKK